MAGKRSRRTQGGRARKRQKIMYRPPASMRYKGAGILLASRFCIKPVIPGLDATPLGGVAYTFSLNDTINPSEFVNLFEEYKINRILYRFVLDRDSDHATTATNRGFATRVMWVHDHTDSTAPASFAELQQYQHCREAWLDTNRQSTKWFSLKPNTIDLGYTTVVANNYGPNYKRWIDTANQSAPYYGLKVFYSNLYAGVQLYVECKLLMSFKGVK